MAEEIWKPIPEYEGHYEASSHGNIRSVDRLSISYGKRLCKRVGRIIKQNTANRYNLVTLSKDGKIVTRTVHRLIAFTFIENPENLPQVDHIDRDQRNNSVCNLRWATRETNLDNRGTPKHNTSGQKYIQYNKAIKRWRVAVKRKSLKIQKYFVTLEEAKVFRDSLGIN